ncbi:plasmid replication protein repA [Aeromonas rivuli]|uniref:plasmid replication protein repA n=1 Tax=Aeromonas rivuli TaxID=648794 RepID=UPI001E2DB143|nr:plasmid replication protein repA [Aeromonas rivuli]
MDSAIEAPCMWGRSRYPHPGKFLGSGNRCGHNPDNPAWDLFTPPETKKDIPHVMRKLQEGIRAYYSKPEMLPTLSNLSGKRNADGNPRLNRSEAREAEALIMEAIIQMTDFATLRVGTPLPNGGFVHRSCTEIAAVAGLLDQNAPADKPRPSQRYWRGFRRLKIAGAFDVHLQYEEQEDGSKRGRPAIKNLNMHFLVAIGRVGYEALKKFRTWCSRKLSGVRAAYAEQFPETHDAEIANRHLCDAQGKVGIKTNTRQPARSISLPDSNERREQQRQYNLDMAKYAAELLAEHSGKPESWVMNQVRVKYPPFDEWLKLQQ